MKTIILLLLLFSECTQEKKYKVVISSIDEETKLVSEIVEEFKAEDDTSAYKHGCKNYWVQKCVRLEMNKTFEKTDPVPFYFIVVREDGTAIGYSKTETERLTKSTVDYFKNKVIPGIDTITPRSKRIKEEPPNVY